MANPLTNIFKRKKIEEVVQPLPQKEEVMNIANLYTNNKVLINGTDVATTDETKLINLYRQMENDAIISAALNLMQIMQHRLIRRQDMLLQLSLQTKAFKMKLMNSYGRLSR